jgi:hypothetical protein
MKKNETKGFFSKLFLHPKKTKSDCCNIQFEEIIQQFEEKINKENDDSEIQSNKQSKNMKKGDDKAGKQK